jgi:hypothetical protein
MLNCSIYNRMEPQENLNPSQENQEDQNSNPPLPPHNVNNEIDERLVILINLEERKEKLTSISYYKEIMYEYYSTGLDKNQIKEMNISKQQILSIFRDPRNGQELYY